MKKALLLIALLATIMVSHAQDPLSYEYIITKDGVPANQIYTQIVDWIATNFKAVDGDFFRDKEEMIITKDVITEFSTNKLRTSCYNGHLRYKLKFQCRDGRFKVQLTNFEHSNNPGNNAGCVLGLLLTEPVEGNFGKFDVEVWQQAKDKADQIAAQTKFTFESMEFKVANDDW